MTKSNPFENIGGMIADGGLGDLLQDSNRFNISIADIRVKAQVRTEFNDEGLNELAESIKQHGVLQNIIVNEKQNEETGETTYDLIAGERRYRASLMAGLNEIPALVLTVSDDVYQQIQILENIQRENLTAIELANVLDSELTELNGNYDLLAAKYNKSRSWLSKAMQMNKVEGAAKEVMAVSSDTEVILGIQQIEKTNPEKAEELVEQIKSDIGKKNVRKTVQKEQKKEREVQAAKKSGKHTPKKESDLKHEQLIDSLPNLGSPNPNPAPKEYDLGGEVQEDEFESAEDQFAAWEADKTKKVDTGIAAIDDFTDMSVTELQKEWDKNIEKIKSNSVDDTKPEVQDIINFGDAIDVFCFKGKEVPDKTYDVVEKQTDILKELYEKAINENNFNSHFLKMLKKAGFKLESKNIDLAALIEMLIIVNSAEPFNTEKLTLNVRDTLEAFNE